MKIKIIKDDKIINEIDMKPRRNRVVYTTKESQKVSIIKDGKIINDYKAINNNKYKNGNTKSNNKYKNNKKENDYKFKTGSKFMSGNNHVNDKQKEVLIEEITPEDMNNNLSEFNSLVEDIKEDDAISAIETLYNNSEEVKEVISDGVKTIEEGFNNIGDAIKDTLISLENPEEDYYEEYSELNDSDEIPFIEDEEDNKYEEYADMYDDSNYEPMKKRNILDEY